MHTHASKLTEVNWFDGMKRGDPSRASEHAQGRASPLKARHQRRGQVRPHRAPELHRRHRRHHRRMARSNFRRLRPRRHRQRYELLRRLSSRARENLRSPRNRPLANWPMFDAALIHWKKNPRDCRSYPYSDRVACQSTRSFVLSRRQLLGDALETVAKDNTCARTLPQNSTRARHRTGRTRRRSKECPHSHRPRRFSHPRASWRARADRCIKRAAAARVVSTKMKNVTSARCVRWNHPERRAAQLMNAMITYVSAWIVIAQLENVAPQAISRRKTEVKRPSEATRVRGFARIFTRLSGGESRQRRGGVVNDADIRQPGARRAHHGSAAASPSFDCPEWANVKRCVSGYHRRQRTRHARVAEIRRAAKRVTTRHTHTHPHGHTTDDIGRFRSIDSTRRAILLQHFLFIFHINRTVVQYCNMYRVFT